MMLLLRERARRHTVATRLITYTFLTWLILYTLSSWIDLFQGFDTAFVLMEYVQGLTIGVVALVIIAFPLWLLFTFLLDILGFPRDQIDPSDGDDVFTSVWDEHDHS